MTSNSSLLQLKYVFGFNKSNNIQLQHLDNHRLIYQAGHNIVEYSQEDNTMKFLPGTEGTTRITCYAISPLKRYLAVAEEAERAVVFVYDIEKPNRRRKILTQADSLSASYVSIAFPKIQENKYLCTLSGEPDYQVTLWHWERPKVMATIKFQQGPLHQLSFSEFEQIFVTGKGKLLWLKYQNSVLMSQPVGISKMEPRLQSSDYTTHALLSDGKLVVGTDTGEIIIFDQNCDYKGVLSVGVENWRVECILPYRGGFLVSGELASIYIFERHPEDIRSQYQRTARPFVISEYMNQKVASMSLSPSEDKLVCAMDNSQVFDIAFNADRPGEDDAAFQNITKYNHSTQICGLDICMRKPLIATCGKDNVICIWNYIEHTLEVKEEFAEEPFSLAFHPSGFHLVVGFADKLRIMNIFEKTIEVFKEIPMKTCREVRFSHGGHLFAATSGHTIQVFNFYTVENPPDFHFKGHSGKVSSIAWHEDDTGFVSVGADGNCYEWKLYTSVKAQPMPYTAKGFTFGSVASTDMISAEARACYAVTSNAQIREIMFPSQALHLTRQTTTADVVPDKPPPECTREMETGIQCGQIQILSSARKLVAGMAGEGVPGSIRCYDIGPLTGDYMEFQAHSTKIERLQISYDDAYVFTVGQDGVVCVFEVQGKAARSKSEKENAEEIIIKKAKMEEKRNQVLTLNAQIKEKRRATEQKQEEDTSTQKSQLDGLEIQHRTESMRENQRYDELQRMISEKKSNFDNEMRRIKEASEEDKIEINSTYEEKILVEVARYKQLDKDKEDAAKSFHEEKETMESNHLKRVSDMEKAHADALEEEARKYNELMRSKDSDETLFEKEQALLEGKNDQELEVIREDNTQEVKAIQDQNKQSKSDLTLKRKQHEEKKTTIEKSKETIKGHTDRILKLSEEIDKLTNEKESMKIEIEERDNTISDKEHKIYDFKRKNQELEKFKFVLDYKIKELKRDIIPKEEEITKLKEQTAEMGKELNHLDGVNENLGLIVADLEMRQKGMENEITSQRQKLTDVGKVTTAFKEGIYDCVQYMQPKTFKQFKEELLALYNRFVVNEVKPIEISVDIQKEYGQQRRYLEKNVTSLKEKLRKETEVHRKDNMRIMRDNVELINEINGLKKEVKSLTCLKRQVDGALRLSVASDIGSERGGHSSPLEYKYRAKIETRREEIRHLRQNLHEIQGDRSHEPSIRGSRPASSELPHRPQSRQVLELPEI